MEQINLKEIISEATDAINYLDSYKAFQILQKIKRGIDLKPMQASDPENFKKIEGILLALRITAFAHLSDEECCDIFKKHYLKSFAIEVPMKSELTAKLFIKPEIPRNTLREQLKRALLENQEKLGPLALGQWVKEFEKMFDVKTRTLSAAVEFVAQNKFATSLSNADKNKLKEILHTYDYLLVTTLPATGPTLDAMLASAPSGETREEDEDIEPAGSRSSAVDSRNYFPAGNQRNREINENAQLEKTEEITIAEALKKYPEIGEQIISQSSLKLTNSENLARPTIKNWLIDYTLRLGYRSHNSVERGTYLFQSENGKRISDTEREKVSQILRSFDQEIAIDVDSKNKKIVLEEYSPQKSINVVSEDHV